MFIHLFIFVDTLNTHLVQFSKRTLKFSTKQLGYSIPLVKEHWRRFYVHSFYFIKSPLSLEDFQHHPQLHILFFVQKVLNSSKLFTSSSPLITITLALSLQFSGYQLQIHICCGQSVISEIWYLVYIEMVQIEYFVFTC